MAAKPWPLRVVAESVGRLQVLTHYRVRVLEYDCTLPVVRLRATRLALDQSFAKFFSKFGRLLRGAKFRRNLGPFRRLDHFRTFRENFTFHFRREPHEICDPKSWKFREARRTPTRGPGGRYLLVRGPTNTKMNTLLSCGRAEPEKHAAQRWRRRISHLAAAARWGGRWRLSCPCV